MTSAARSGRAGQDGGDALKPRPGQVQPPERRCLLQTEKDTVSGAIRLPVVAPETDQEPPWTRAVRHVAGRSGELEVAGGAATGARHATRAGRARCLSPVESPPSRSPFRCRGDASPHTLARRAAGCESPSVGSVTSRPRGCPRRRGVRYVRRRTRHATGPTRRDDDRPPPDDGEEIELDRTTPRRPANASSILLR